MTRGFFVTGTDTGVGKTAVSVALLTALGQTGYRTAALKPVASGCRETSDGLRNDDALALMSAATVALPYDTVNPYAFLPPIAPHLAARQVGQRIEIEAVVDACSHAADMADIVVVEGAGGWQVPLNEEQTMADLARALGLPVVPVVAIRVGCLNHALLTCESIVRYGLPLAGWVANFVDQSDPVALENVKTLRARIGAPLIASVPVLEKLDGHAIVPYLERQFFDFKEK